VNASIAAVDHERNDEELFATRTRIASPPLLPELSLHIAVGLEALWQELAEGPQTPPPYWGCPWIGGQALARYLLDHVDVVRGKRVLDLGTGSGVVAIAAARAGAAHVLATDIDRRALAAARSNAALNGVELELAEADVLDETRGEDVILAGDLCYERPLAERVRAFLSAHASSATVLIGDPGRAYFVASSLEPLARYEVLDTRDVEGRDSRNAGVFRVRA